jgi:hypothetical protein
MDCCSLVRNIVEHPLNKGSPVVLGKALHAQQLLLDEKTAQITDLQAEVLSLRNELIVLKAQTEKKEPPLIAPVFTPALNLTPAPTAPMTDVKSSFTSPFPSQQQPPSVWQQPSVPKKPAFNIFNTPEPPKSTFGTPSFGFK